MKPEVEILAEPGTEIMIEPGDLVKLEQKDGAKILYSMTQEEDGTVKIRPGNDGRIRLQDEEQVRFFIDQLLDLCR